MTDRNDALVALANEIEIDRGMDNERRDDYSKRIRALAAPAEGGQGEAVKWECRVVNKKTGNVHHDWYACSQTEFDNGNTQGSTLRVEYRALYTAPPAASVDVAWLRDLSDDDLRDVFHAQPELSHRLARALIDSAGGAKGEDVGTQHLLRMRKFYKHYPKLIAAIDAVLSHRPIALGR